jgi:hypothetical protein
MGRQTKANLELQYTLSDLKEVVKKHLLLDDYSIVDVLTAAVIANVLPGLDPLWLMFVGPSSSAKTELLNSLEPLSHTFFVSDLTKSSLISGQDNASLLPRLKNKTMVMKDFTTILSKKPDDVRIIMSQFREVYDGKLSKAYGTGKVVKFKGHVGFIGACTSAYDKHYGVIGQMGERFLLYRIKNKDQRKTAIRAVCDFGCETTMREELQAAFKKFFNQFKKSQFTIRPPAEILAEKISYLVDFCTMARCSVSRDRFTKEITHMPEVEGTPRLAKQLYHLALSLKYVRNEPEITDDIYKVIKKVALDVAPKYRVVLLKQLYSENAMETFGRWLKTGEIAAETNIHTKTVLRTLQDLSQVGLLRWRESTEYDDTGTRNVHRPYEWQISTHAYECITGAGLF